ncbi:MAG: adenylosuccinate synthetase [Bacteroides sp. SM23_62_1]|nr:MAG: adenylosuccinate synthetase [Bacteroides sp. SM23_62_1]
MKADILLGLQWGDEGKGKLVDVLTPNYDVIARFQGGPNAGHTLEFNHIKHISHNIPSGVFRESSINVIGNGVVLDPISFKAEIDDIYKIGIDLKGRLKISRKAHLIMPTHRILDAASEAAKGQTKIGSTLRGIGPTYMDKTGRNGLRVGDILSSDFMEKYRFLIKKHQEILKQFDFDYQIKDYEAGWFDGIETMKQFEFVNSEYLINRYLNEGKSLLAEGAQGTMLDIDFGSYPYVTSSNTICAGACTGLGIAPNKVGEVMGVFKAYSTRVGGGPFPTELTDETGELLRKHGGEYGATTGRPRRCGWLDLPVLKYAIMLNGVSHLLMTKADVLSHFSTIKVCTAYNINGTITEEVPFDIQTDVEPVFVEMKSWGKDISGIRKAGDLPPELKDYVVFIEEQTGVPVKIIGVGPEREQFIELS